MVEKVMLITEDSNVDQDWQSRLEIKPAGKDYVILTATKKGKSSISVSLKLSELLDAISYVTGKEIFY